MPDFNENIRRRLIIIQDKRSKSVSDFASQLGMEQVTVNNYLIGKRKVSLEVVYTVLEKYADISAEWLLRGIGSMESASARASEPSSDGDVVRYLMRENQRLAEDNRTYIEKYQQLSEKFVNTLLSNKGVE